MLWSVLAGSGTAVKGTTGNPYVDTTEGHVSPYINVSTHLYEIPCDESSGSLLLPSLVRDATGNLGCFHFGLTQTRPTRAEAASALLSKELLQASARDGPWAATFLPTVGTVCPLTAPLAALHPHQECGKGPPD